MTKLAAIALPVVFCVGADKPPMTDAEVRQVIVGESVAAYSGSCACPFSVDLGGRRCGGRSAYSRPGGASPKCYARDVSDEEVERLQEAALDTAEGRGGERVGLSGRARMHSANAYRSERQ